MKQSFQPLAAAPRPFVLDDVKEPNLLRDQFPYSEVPRIVFDGQVINPDPAPEIWITDTTFRDGQQARPPYKPRQIIELYKMLHRLGGPNGVVRQSEFFLYSKRDQEAVNGCLELGYQFPEVTGWIRADPKDFALVKSLGLRETGILTSVSDYHIFLKLKKTREKVMDSYLGVVKDALAAGIVPRCHFEDVTRADIYGFCLPFAAELMNLSRESGIPIKIRLCDTMGYGVTYPGAALPRSVDKLAYAFHREAGVPCELLEWHGHNDFHKVHVNAVTGWFYGIAALNASLLGFGERTGNPPLEGAIIEYISLLGHQNGIDTTVITEIANYFRDEIKADVPSNYPFVGSEFNTTRAGIHADGVLKNQEIYNIFDTEALLNRPLKVSVTDKSGLAGIAEWLNEYAHDLLARDHREPINKRHPGVRRINDWVMEQYEQGRTTGISHDEMIAQAKHHLPSLFKSDFQKVKEAALAKGKAIAKRVSKSPDVLSLEPGRIEAFLKTVVQGEPAIQLIAITNTEGRQISHVHTQRGEKGLFRALFKENFTDHEWFRNVLATGESYASDLFFSRFTNKLVLTFAEPIRDSKGNIVAVMDVDLKFDELTQLVNRIPNDSPDHDEPAKTTK
ncbi:MAG: histone-lysine N-methyltransferase [Lentisphaeria bacterium]|jgi:isopropylmalate/homocitrate/citramalate synthase|nr:histone-lysine N-methyltransferase [Lentisphaeria bacterium]